MQRHLSGEGRTNEDDVVEQTHGGATMPGGVGRFDNILRSVGKFCDRITQTFA